MAGEPEFEIGDYIFVPDIKALLDGDMKDIPAYILGAEGNKEIQLSISAMTAEEKEIIKAGCLINYNRNRAK